MRFSKGKSYKVFFAGVKRANGSTHIVNGSSNVSNGVSYAEESSTLTSTYPSDSSNDSEILANPENGRWRIRKLGYPTGIKLSTDIKKVFVFLILNSPFSWSTVNGHPSGKANVSTGEPKQDLKRSFETSKVFNSQSSSNDHQVFTRKKSSFPSTVGKTEAKGVIPKARPNSVGRFQNQKELLILFCTPKLSDGTKLKLIWSCSFLLITNY